MRASGNTETRTDRRQPCKIKATARYLGQDVRAAILNVSEGGVKIYLATDLGYTVSRQIVVISEELGHLNGQIAWVRFPYMGVRLNACSNTSAKIFSFYRP